MSNLEVAIVGYGNVGRGVHRALEENEDMSLAGIITRGPERVKKELEGKGETVPTLVDATIEGDFTERLPADVAVLCGGSKEDLPKQAPLFARYYNTVDSFDTHGNIPDYYDNVNRAAERGGHVSIVSTGWDPGLFSLQRVMADSYLPGATHNTFWGPGVSQGHSDAARQVEGVEDARSYTLPDEEIMEEIRAGKQLDLSSADKHRRLVYVVAEEGADREKIRREIKNMPEYFKPYSTEIEFLSSEEMETDHSNYPHGGVVFSGAQTSPGEKTSVEFRCQWASNPEATARIMVACARAAYRLNSRGCSGARTILQVPPADLSPRSHEQLLAEFM